MKVLILAGGLGTRMSEETSIKPKPMVEIGGMPLIWHIMKLYSYHGFNEFVILLGYKSYYIKEYFYHYYLHNSDVTLDVSNGKATYHGSRAEPWKITLLDTGLETMTGGRLFRAKDYIQNQRFMLTYGDGLADLDIKALLAHHEEHGRLATVTSYQPDGRFGGLEVLDGGSVKSFSEKPKGESGWISAGFFVFEPEVFNFIKGDDSTVLEQEPLKELARAGELHTYHHNGFWKPCDSLWDKQVLEKFWSTGCAPWRVW